MTDSGPVVRGPDWLRHRVADKLSRPGVEASDVLVTSRIGNMISYTLVVPFDRYASRAVGVVASLTADMDLVVCHNRWGRRGVQGLFCVLRDRTTRSLIETQIHTPASAGAREHAHLMRDLIEQAGIGTARAVELRRRQAQVLAAVPVPTGAPHLSWPGTPDA
jgi:hypothetical protein